MTLYRLLITAVALSWLSTGCQLPDPDDYKNTPPAPKTEPVQPPPLIIGFVVADVLPSEGKPRGMELVEIHGGGFQEGAQVFFGSSQALNTVVSSAGQITTQTPPHSAGMVTVRVVNPDGGEASLEDGFQYRADVLIERIEPSFGPVLGGLPVEIHGRGLVETDVVLFGGRMALDVTVLSDDTVLAVLPEGTAGLADVHVVGFSGVARLIKGFRYVAPLHISGLSPLTSSPAGGGTLSLTGTGLESSCRVFIDGQPAEMILMSDTGLKQVVRIPPGDVGAVDLLVICENDSIELPKGFSYVADDTNLSLHGLWPSHGPLSGGGEVSLAVHGLGDAPPNTRVLFGDNEATIVSVLPEQNRVSVLAPPGIAEAVISVSVEVPTVGTSVLSGAYQYVNAMAIQSVSPTHGPSDGGTRITIHGRGFAEGPLDVFVGALPASHVQVLDDQTIQATTGAGSPGTASIRVIREATNAILPFAFEYQTDDRRLFACEPPAGAIAGNTLVSLYGVGLPSAGSVWFDQQHEATIDHVSSTHMIVRSPRAEDIGPVTIHAEGEEGDAIHLPQDYVYYDPRAEWGGVWGEPIDHSVNITVRETLSGDAIESALVVVGHDVPPKAMGYTDERGQVTLSTWGLKGPLDISAAKENHSAASIMAFDATNVTLSLETAVPSPPGPPGPVNSFPPGAVSGMVYGIGKYLVLPPGQCTDVSDPTAGFCTPCSTDSDCLQTAPACTTLPDQEPFCSKACATDTDCPESFVCAGVVNDEPRCIPDRGERQVRCYVSSGALFQTPQLDPLAIVNVDKGEQAFAIENVRLGEVAIYCIGGVAKTVNGKAVFIPYVMGVDRHVFIPPGPDPESGDPLNVVRVDIALDIPLQRAVNATVEQRPFDEKKGPNTAEVQVWLELGSDGLIPIRTQALEPADRNIVLDHLPNTLSGELYDASYVYYAAALTDKDDLLPTSEVLREAQETMDSGAYYRFNGESWLAQSSGYDGDVLAVHVLPTGNALAATEQGGVLAFNGLGWSQQPVAKGPPLRAIASDGQDGVVIVGDEGRILRWNGVGWEDHNSGLSQDLRAVVNTGTEAAVAVGHYAVVSWDGGHWTPVAHGPPKDLNGVCRADNNSIWAVGEHGAVIHRDGVSGPWYNADVPFYDSLKSVWCDPNGVVIAVGEGGRALVGQSMGGGFESMPLPVSRTMHAVWGRGPHDVYAAGDGATLLHFDGVDWTLVHEGTMDVSLRSIHGGADAGGAMLAMGTHALHLGPFVWIPAFEKPIPSTAWNPMDVAFSLEMGASPSLHAMRIYGASGSLSWSITASGTLPAFTLPNFWAIDGLMVPLPGPKQMYSFLVDHPDFDINHFDIRAFRLRDWRGWAISTVGFDNP